VLLMPPKVLLMSLAQPLPTLPRRPLTLLPQ